MVILLAVPGSLLLQRVINDDESADPLSAGPAPAFSLPDLDGDEVSLEALSGDPVVVHFWGSWCDPCEFQFELLTQAHKKYPEVRFVGILYRDDPAEARRFARRYGADWPMLVDDDEAAAGAYGVEGVPLTFFIDRDGEITGSMVNEYSRPLLERQLRRIL